MCLVSLAGGVSNGKTMFARASEVAALSSARAAEGHSYIPNLKNMDYACTTPFHRENLCQESRIQRVTVVTSIANTM